MNDPDLLPIDWALTPKLRAKMENTGVNLRSPTGYGWMGHGPESLQFSIQYAVDKFQESVPEMPDAIAFTGSSGAAIAFPLAVKYKLPLIMVRKDHEKSHGVSLECNYNGYIKNFMIVDDFICTGMTVRRILAKIAVKSRERGYRPPPCIGIYQWGEGRSGEFRKFGRQDIPLYMPVVPEPVYDDEEPGEESLFL